MAGAVQLLQETMQKLLPHLLVIRRLIDALALLDMLASLAQVSCGSCRCAWVREHV